MLFIKGFLKIRVFCLHNKKNTVLTLQVFHFAEITYKE